MSHQQFLMRMHKMTPWKSRDVYYRLEIYPTIQHNKLI
jgi:hypothetical protein